MAPQSWADDEQWNWLIDRGVGWREAQKTSQTTPWFNGMCIDWLLEYDEADALWGKGSWQRPFTIEQAQEYAAAVEVRKTKLQTWFHNHGHKTSRRGGAKKVANSVKVPRAKNTRALQEIELYSKLYYKTRVKGKVKAELKRLKLERHQSKLPCEVRLEIVRRFTQTSYDNETAAIRAEIAAGAAEEKARSRALIDASKKEVIDVDTERTPEEYQHAIDQAPADIRRLLAPVHYHTGCSIMVIVTGPVPENGGAIGSFAVHFGENQLGHNFAQVTPNFRDLYARPHVHFAKGIYSEEIRQGRALPPSITGISLPSTSSTTPGGIGTPSSSPSVSPSPATSTQELPDTSFEVATPLFILEERAKKAGVSSRASGSRHGPRITQDVLDNIEPVVEPASDVAPFIPRSGSSGSTVPVPRTSTDGDWSAWPGNPTQSDSGSTAWGAPYDGGINMQFNGGGMTSGDMTGGDVNMQGGMYGSGMYGGGMYGGAMYGGGGMFGGGIGMPFNSSAYMVPTNNIAFDADGLPIYNPSFPESGVATMASAFSYHELTSPLGLPMSADFPGNAATAALSVPGLSGADTNVGTPFTSASSPPSSPRSSAPLTRPPTPLSDAAPGPSGVPSLSDVPEAETRTTRTGRAVKIPKRKDATYKDPSKRRRVR